MLEKFSQVLPFTILFLGGLLKYLLSSYYTLDIEDTKI